MLWWLIQNTVVACLLAAIVWLACRARRLSPTLQHALWLIVLVKLVTPPLVAWPWSLPDEVELAWMNQGAKSEWATAPEVHASQPADLTTSSPAVPVDPALQEFARRIEEIDQGNTGIVDILASPI